MAGETRPDVVIAPCGGGSNLGGLSLPFVEDTDVRLVAVEPSSCPTLTEGRFEYDFGDTAGMTPLLPMYTLGHDFMPPPHPRRRAALPRRLADHLPCSCKTGRMEAHRLPAGQGVRGRQALRQGRGQGRRRPRPATASAPRSTRRSPPRRTGEERVILFNYCGHGFLDLSAYDDFNHGRLVDA